MKKINTLLIFLLVTAEIILLNGNTYTQVNQEWVATYYGPGNWNDVPHKILVDGSNNVFVSGNSFGYGTYSDFTLMKYNSSGIEQWINRYNGSQNTNDYCNNMLFDKSGFIYLIGATNSSYNYSDLTLIKYNSSGVQQWIASYPYTTGKTICLDSSNYIYAAGNIYYENVRDSNNIILIKYNISGIPMWAKIFNSINNKEDYVISIGVDDSSNIYMSGHCRAGQYEKYDIFLVKYDSSGAQKWVKYFDRNNNIDAVNAMVLGKDAIYIVGESYGTYSFGDAIVMKYNSTGTLEWYKLYAGNSNYNRDVAIDCRVGKNGSLYVTGWVTNPSTSTDFYTIKYNQYGDSLWIRQFNGPVNGYDGAMIMTLDSNDNVYTAGSIQDTGSITNNYNYETIKYDSLGNLKWNISYTSIANYEDHIYSICVKDNNVYVTGNSYNRWATIKYSQQVGIQPISIEIPEQYSLYQNYPNPFNPSTKIKFDIGTPLPPFSKGGIVTLKIFDVIGREISTLVNEQLNSGTYEVEWNASNYPSGVYFYRLISDGVTIDTKKLILLK